ncbi:MAG: DNA gyrase inhibitor YacG [Hyphomicrobiaceae bacterium]
MNDGGDSERSDMPGTRRCSICGKPVVERYRPFCSKRCADVDLARWLGGTYVIQGGNQDADEDGDEAAGAAEAREKPRADD